VKSFVWQEFGESWLQKPTLLEIPTTRVEGLITIFNWRNQRKLQRNISKYNMHHNRNLRYDHNVEFVKLWME
jgi:hypothetical protein